MRDQVTVHIDASPERVWAVVADVTAIGRFSPETFEAEWLDGFQAPAVGARFRGHVRRNGRGPVYWAPCTITTCEAPRELAFTVGPGATPFITWRYRLEPSGGGTDVTESYEISDGLPNRLYWRLFGRARGRTNARNMRATLEGMKAEIEGAAAP